MTQSMAEQADKERAERERNEREDAFKAQKEREERVERYMGQDEYVVLGQLIQLKVRNDAGGFIVKQFNAGAVIQAEDVDEENLRSQVEMLLVVPVDADEARFAAPAGTPMPGEPPNVPVQDGTPVEMLPHEERLRRQAEAADKPEKTAEDKGRPHGNASQAQWVDYAVAKRDEGTSEEDARAEAKQMTKEQLVAKYGKR
jgi:hypothetical protein